MVYYKKITSKQMNEMLYYIEPFLNEPIVMEFESITEVILGSILVIGTKEMVSRFNQMN